jgi:hypothetical protein
VAAAKVVSSYFFFQISVHKDLRSLYEKVPKQNLPSDYGGELQSVKELLKVWDEIFTKKIGFLENIEQLCHPKGRKGRFSVSRRWRWTVA